LLWLLIAGGAKSSGSVVFVHNDTQCRDPLEIGTMPINVP